MCYILNSLNSFARSGCAGNIQELDLLCTDLDIEWFDLRIYSLFRLVGEVSRANIRTQKTVGVWVRS